MIILAVGMPRAGSGWHYNLTHDLMITTGATDARKIRRQYRLQSILTEVNCNIGILSFRRTALAAIPSLLGNTYTLKLHAGPTPWGNLLIKTGHMRPTFIYRDPRDALLSAFEYGERARAAGKENTFSHLTSIEKAIEFIDEYVGYWKAWQEVPHRHQLRYEDFKTRYDEEARRLAAFLHVDTDNPAAAAVIEKYRPEQAARGDKGLHFQKGLTGRFREVLTPAQQQACLDRFGPALAEMGYE